MKLECPVIKDLYILYSENELSNEVKDAVDEHLKNCSSCREVYEKETGFDDILKNTSVEQPSKKLDERLMLKLKIARLKAGIIFIAAIFLISIYFNYVETRKNLLYDISQVEHRIHHMTFKIGDIKNKLSPIDDFISDIQELNDQHSIVRRDLNFMEKSALKKSPNNMFMNFKVSILAEILKLRYKNGTFTERDEKAYTLLKQYMDEILILLGNERQSLNKLHGYEKFSILFKPINIKDISESYNKINQLSLIYTEYGKFPDEISPMSLDETKKRLKFVMNIDDGDIEFYSNRDSNIRLDGNCNFNVISNNKEQRYYGTIDAYTGRLLRISMGHPRLEGELLPVEDVKNNVLAFLKREYGNNQEFNIKYMGVNHCFSSNVDIKLHSYQVHSMYKGFKIDVPFIVYFDARAGILYSLTKHTSYDFIMPDYNIDTAVKIGSEEALKNTMLEIDNKEAYKYTETSIIKSKLTGKYVLVHIYDNEDRKIYINASSGNQEFNY